MKSVNILIFTDCTSVIYGRVIGAYRIATELRKHGYSVQVVDYFLLAGLQKTIELINKFVGPETIFVGFSTTFMNVNEVYLNPGPNSTRFKYVGQRGNISTVPALFTHGIPIGNVDLAAIKEAILAKAPKAKLVMGGGKAVYHDKHYHSPPIDVFIKGYADKSVIDFANYLSGKNPFFQFKTLPNNRMLVDDNVTASGFDFSRSITEYTDSDFIRHGEVLPIETARGCIFNCKFCSFPMNGKKKFDYLKDGESLYAEMMNNYERLGTTKYIFADDTYNDSIYKIEHFGNVFARLPFKIEYVAYLRHDLINRFPEMADILKESGLRSTIMGIETLNHEAGKIIGKGLHPQKTREVLQWLRDDKGWKHNIYMSSGFIVGLPSETPETVTKWANELIFDDYPLDSVVFSPLFINSIPGKSDRSEFEINSEKYGYSFDTSSLTSWKNDTWRYEDTLMLSNSLMGKAIENGRGGMNGFQAMILHNYGVSMREVFQKSAGELYKGTFFKTLEQASSYHSQLLSYELK